MERHYYKGAISTGNPFQPLGKHRDCAMLKGVGLIPLGDRDRDIPEGIGVLEERLSVDKYSKYSSRLGF